MDQSLETSLETLNLTGQQQPSIPDASNVDDLDKILAEFESYVDNNTIGANAGPFDIIQINEPFDINALINPSSNSADSSSVLNTQFSGFSIDDDTICDLLDSFQKEEPQEYGSSPPHSTFIENYNPTSCSQFPQAYTSPASIPVGSSPVEPKASETVLYTQEYLNQQDEIYRTATKTKRHKGHQRHHTTNVRPFDAVIHSGGCEPCTPVHMHNEYAYQQQQLEYDAVDSKQIQIRCQPRSKFRPRTQNESKNSSHYLRCEDGVKPEYPTISIPQTWFFQSDVNLIEVTLVGLDKQPHPYALENKTSSDTYEDNVLIFKQNDPNVLYFRLTPEDFQNGYKTFMIELIKGKQDDVITKDLIRIRQLEHSMLRFTRIFQLGKGNFQRDDGSAEYSSVMSEAYGDVDIEHMGPRYGPMSGQEMVYVVMKGRILKNDLKIEITENFTGWRYSVDSFTKNGNVVFFVMPGFPYSVQCESIKANIIIYYKGEELFQSPYLYKGSLDQDLAELRISDPNTTTASSAMSNNFDLFGYASETGARPNSASRRSSTSKIPKRLKPKSKK